MNIINGGVTAAKGYKASGVEAGIKYSNRKDMALVYSEKPATVAGTFTTNVVKASPVIWDKKLVESGNPVRAVVLNSGIANACTGSIGDEYNLWMADEMAKALSINVDEVCTASTGVIGMQLKKEPIAKGCVMLADTMADTYEAGTLAAEAIMTTDTVSKQCAASFEVDGVTVTVGGMSKGSGMIHPNMATMLCVITTDAVITKELLQTALSDVVKESFNMISVDRDTSTNDTALLLANGEAGNKVIDKKDENYEKFVECLKYVCVTLAKIMAADGEGATKLLEVKVINASCKEDASVLAKSVITSNLVKTAVYGSDANWGRILCALGYSGKEFDPYLVDIIIESVIGSLKLVENGISTDYSEEFATKILADSEVTVICDMKSGNEEATAWGCDLTYDYVKINGDYRS
ncbi:MAG: bifunctional glutamate N-acetyltransferase/amino-acid acetyltransferase ArgJ [Lachnospiraceae bacterium]|nr:bifunctional glutamate N-acetyltransferase/amino-acid acetyltransferase ArgJ [Lachnospiraceae bacterium]